MASGTPEQYRALAADNDRLENVALPARLAEQHSAAVSAALRAAADEVDRLRIGLRHAQEDRAAHEADCLVLMVREKRLRTMIENAPHEYYCLSINSLIVGQTPHACTCWKADAL